MKKVILLVLGLLLCLTLLPVEASAEGHEFLIDDQAGLLTTEEAESLRINYAGILDYASTGLVTTPILPRLHRLLGGGLYPGAVRQRAGYPVLHRHG